jgi:hypothetical protein
MTLSEIIKRADDIHYIRRVDDLALNIIPQEHFAYAMKSLFIDGFYAFRHFDKNIVLINSILNPPS